MLYSEVWRLLTTLQWHEKFAKLFNRSPQMEFTPAR